MNTQQPHILIVEDDESYQVLLADAFADADFLVSMANNAEQAREKITDHPDVVLLDYTLPGADGDELLAEIRAEGDVWGTRVPIFILTQHDDFEKIARTVEGGATAYFVKSDVELGDIVEAVQKQLSE